MVHMSDLKDRLRTDLTAAIKARDEVRSSTLRMVLTAITNAEVAGKEARELTDDDVIGVLSAEAKKRREAAEAFADAGRADSAAKERAEAGGDRRLPAGAARRRRDRRAGHRGDRRDRRGRRGHAGDGQGDGRACSRRCAAAPTAAWSPRRYGASSAPAAGTDGRPGTE